MYRLFLIIAGLGIICVSYFNVSGQENNMLPNIKQDTTSISALLRQARIVGKTKKDSAVILFKEALVISYQLHSDKDIARSLLGFGAYVFNKGDYKESKKIFYRAIPYCLKAFPESSLQLADLYDDLGNVCSIQGKTDSAIRYYFKSLEIMKKNSITDSSLLKLLYANIGAMLASNNKGDQALFYLNIAMQYSARLKDTTTYLQSLMNFGLAYETKEAEDSARSYWKKAIEFSKLTNRKKYIAQAYCNIGNSMAKQGRLNEAKAYFDSAIQADPQGAIQNFSLQDGIGSFYAQSGNYIKAIPYFEKAIEDQSSMGVIYNRLYNYQNLAECYSKIGSKNLAYKYLELYSNLRDSLLTEQQIEANNQIEIKYRTSEKDKEIAQKQLIIFTQQSKIEQKDLWIALMGGGSLVFLILGLTLFRNYQRKQQIASLYTKQQQQQAQLKVLMQGEENERKRIARELHDGIGSLISAAKLHLRNTNDTSHENYENGLNLLDDAYNELRLTAHNLVPELLLNEGLVNALRTYCNKISKHSLFNVSFLHFGKEISLAPEKELSLYRIVQELVHNAHKHGNATEVTVQLNYNSHHLYISIEDNGAGLPIEENENPIKSGGIGLQNLKDRIALFGANMEMDNRPGMGITFYIEIGVE